MVDDLQSGRQRIRTALNETLLRPVDPDEAEQWDRDRWGMTAEALSHQQQQDAWMDEFTVG